MKRKLITLDDLAGMVNNGFEDMRKRFDVLEKRTGNMEKRLDRLPTRGELLNYAALQKQVTAVREYLRDTFSAKV